MPFSHENRRAFAIKYFAFVGTGFSIPFIAVYWQLYDISVYHCIPDRRADLQAFWDSRKANTSA